MFARSDVSMSARDWQSPRLYLLKALLADRHAGVNRHVKRMHWGLEEKKKKKRASILQKQTAMVEDLVFHKGLKMMSANRIKSGRRCYSKNKRTNSPELLSSTEGSIQHLMIIKSQPRLHQAQGYTPLPLVWGELNKKYLSREKETDKQTIL